MSDISDETLAAYIQIARTPGIGAVTFARLMSLYQTPQEALEHLPELSKRGGRKTPLKPLSASAAQKEIKATRAKGGTYLVAGTSSYPKMLKALPDAPPVICAFGHKHLLDKPAVAMVGARNASAAAQKLAASIASGVSEQGFIVVSGLARGIDATAHESALAGGTIAVLGNGVDQFYPTENKKLQQDILEQGLVLTEYVLGTTPQARQFPRRNRIISGLSLGVVVIEAARKSGSLITANLAAEQGREVMAVPSSPLDARSEGSNHLIREGASLVENAGDVLEILRPLLQHDLREAANGAMNYPKTAPEASDSEREQVVSLLSVVPIMVDELVEMSGLPVASVHLILLELELSGRLLQEAGGKISLPEG